MVLEKFDETYDFDSTMRRRDIAKTIVDLTLSNTDRDLLKFYRKRMNCKCLKRMHLEARKTQPKLGACHHCNEIKERSLLMVCSRCMIDHYCSKECQVSALPVHREDCDKFVETWFNSCNN